MAHACQGRTMQARPRCTEAMPRGRTMVQSAEAGQGMNPAADCRTTLDRARPAGVFFASPRCVRSSW
jgi:hypothetical protein